MSLDFCRTITATAKNQYQCEICFEKISIGESYQRTAGVYDGDFFSAKTHRYCHRFYENISTQYGDKDPLCFSDTAEAADYEGELHIYHDLIEQFNLGSGI